jgi:luciferase family oxidoreductase group 1
MALPLSVLDLAPIGSGYTAAQALHHSMELARAADRLGYTRYWFAEHHGMPSIASSSPEILIGLAAQATVRIRVGAGGIMLPNHVPLRVAESFHTLEALYPGRIDLGIGRAPGSNPATSAALRPFPAEKFAEQLAELISLSRADFPADHPFHRVRVVPSEVPLPPVWILGSSGASAQLAGALGMGYSFARHFSLAPPAPAVDAYRESFRPSAEFPKPHVILGLSVVCAETDEEARYLAASADLMRLRLQRGEFLPIPTPDEALAHPFTDRERAMLDGYRDLLAVGSPEVVRARIQEEAAAVAADEVMISTIVHDPKARMKSYELISVGG